MNSNILLTQIDAYSFEARRDAMGGFITVDPFSIDIYDDRLLAAARALDLPLAEV